MNRSIRDFLPLQTLRFYTLKKKKIYVYLAFTFAFFSHYQALSTQQLVIIFCKKTCHCFIKT
jgi:hypothetical protein